MTIALHAQLALLPVTGIDKTPTKGLIRYHMHASFLARGHFLYMRLGDQIAQGDPIQKFMNAGTQVFPQLMRQAGLVTMAVFFTAATSGIDILVYRHNNFSDRDLGGFQRQGVTTARASHLSTSPLRRSLANSCSRYDRDIPAVGDVRQSHRAFVITQGQIAWLSRHNDLSLSVS
jgi:hypothetical protein